MYRAGRYTGVRQAVLTVFLLILSGIASISAFAATTVTLAWDPSVSTNVAGYNVYYGATSGNYTNSVSAGLATSATISGLADNTIYYFAATAYDTDGIESDFSVETNYITSPPLNYPPTLNPIANLTINENAGQQTVILTGISSGSSNELQTLSVSSVSRNTRLIPNPSVTYFSPNSTATLRFTPTASTNGTATIIVAVSDGQSQYGMFSRSFVVTVVPTNQRPPNTNTAPVISAIANQSTTQDVAIVGIPFTVGDQETPAASLTVSASSSNPTLIPNGNIVFGGSGSNRNVTITPAAGKGGTANITISVNDGTASASRTFQVAVAAITSHDLTVSQEGQGTISPNLSSKVIAGHTYTLTAKPATGQEFAGWTGSIVSDSPKITFKANSNMVLHAKFVVSPFIPILGTYNGLFNENSEVAQYSSGSFSITVGNHGVYSARIQLGASRLAFTGKLNLQCTSSNSVKRKLGVPLSVELRVGTNAEIDQIFGQLSDNTWTATMAGDRARFSAKSNPAPFAGSYTLIIPGQGGDSSKPAGYSYGTVKVATSGVAVFAGILADGTKVSQSAALSKNGIWPFYASLYTGQGSLMSWLTFANQASSDLTGTLSWIKLPVGTAHYYAGGFTNEVMASGSTYVKPATPDDLIINVPNGIVAFSGGNLNPDFSSSISLSSGSHVTDESGNKLTMAFSVSNGLYKGTVVDPASGATMPFAGAVFQKIAMGFGSLMGANQSSSAIVSP